MATLDPAVIYLLNVNNENTRTLCEIFSKLTIKTSEQRHWQACRQARCTSHKKRKDSLETQAARS